MQFWHVALVLVALGRHLGHHPRPFTVAELFAWAPELKRQRIAHGACILLCRKGLLAPTPAPVGHTRANQVAGRPAQWQMTEAGQQAARTAHGEAAARGRAQALRSANLTRSYPDTLATRLWTLLRARRILTVHDAVELLGDAGEDTQRLRKQVGLLLSAWSTLLPQTVKVSRQKIDRCKRYVLDGDVSRLPPDELRNARARVSAVRRSAKAANALENQP